MQFRRSHLHGVVDPGIRPRSRRPDYCHASRTKAHRPLSLERAPPILRHSSPRSRNVRKIHKHSLYVLDGQLWIPGDAREDEKMSEVSASLFADCTKISTRAFVTIQDPALWVFQWYRPITPSLLPSKSCSSRSPLAATSRDNLSFCGRVAAFLIEPHPSIASTFRGVTRSRRRCVLQSQEPLHSRIESNQMCC